MILAPGDMSSNPYLSAKSLDCQIMVGYIFHHVLCAVPFPLVAQFQRIICSTPRQQYFFFGTSEQPTSDCSSG